MLPNKPFEEVVRLLEQFQIDHLGIKTFYFRFDEEPLNDSDYPKMVVEYRGPGYIERGATIDPLTIYFMDLMKDDKSDRLRIISDMKILCQDFYAYFQEIDYNGAKFILPERLPINPVKAANKDNAIGFSIDIEIKTMQNLYHDDVQMDV
jgi:hypothetical protein